MPRRNQQAIKSDLMDILEFSAKKTEQQIREAAFQCGLDISGRQSPQLIRDLRGMGIDLLHGTPWKLS